MKLERSLFFLKSERGAAAEYETPGGEKMLPLLLNQTLRGRAYGHLTEDSRRRE